jgi:NAD(P)H dehydrogenase (quinone)
MMKYHLPISSFVLLALLVLGPGCVERPVLDGAGSTTVQADDHLSVHILVAYYTRSGHTEKMAHGVVAGCERVPGVIVTLKPVDQVTKADLEIADGIILGGPVYFANLPGEMKTILDTWNWKLKVDFTNKIGGAFATAGGQVGGQGHVVTSLLLFMLNNRMVVAGPLYRNETTGSIWGESGAAAITGPLDPGVTEKELEAAQRLGERIARIASKKAL